MKKLLVVLMALSLMSSCAMKERVVTVVEHHTDTLRETRNIRDSIYLHDSVWVKQYERGETVFVEKEKWHTRYQDRLLVDTVYESHTDSVPVPYEVIKEVPAKLTKTQTGLIWIGLLALIALVAFVAVRVRRLLPW